MKNQAIKFPFNGFKSLIIFLVKLDLTNKVLKRTLEHIKNLLEHLKDLSKTESSFQPLVTKYFWPGQNHLSIHT